MAHVLWVGSALAQFTTARCQVCRFWLHASTKTSAAAGFLNVSKETKMMRTPETWCSGSDVVFLQTWGFFPGRLLTYGGALHILGQEWFSRLLERVEDEGKWGDGIALVE
jgi:hypothetical protein